MTYNYAGLPPVSEENPVPTIPTPEKLNEIWVEQHTLQLITMLPDAELDYITKRISELNQDDAAFHELACELSLNRNYPKYCDDSEKELQNAQRRKVQKGMSVQEYDEYFGGDEKAYLAVLEESFDDDILKGITYEVMMMKVCSHKKQTEELKRYEVERAKVTGVILECECCYCDDLLFSDMSPCSGEPLHFFCNTCIRRHTEELIGQGRLNFGCLNGDCSASFELVVLKTLLNPSIFAKLLERIQMEEIAAANIADLVSCPFCNFCTIMPNPEDKVFQCLNSKCLKDSCRFCKKLNHVPKTCKEIIDEKSRLKRDYVEDQMTMAVLRECYKCKKPYVKNDGCNKIVCSCGAVMCYQCRMPISGYDHFDRSPQCVLHTNSAVMHATELKNKVEELKSNGTYINLAEKSDALLDAQPATNLT